MNINLSLIGQMITFILFIGATMKWVWPGLSQAMEDRRKKIADGLAAAEEGVRKLEIAQHKSAEMLRDAKIQAAEILEQANKRGSQLIDEAKGKARDEGERLINLASQEIDKEKAAARAELMEQVATLAIAGAEHILQKKVDQQANDDIFNKLVSGNE